MAIIPGMPRQLRRKSLPFATNSMSSRKPPPDASFTPSIRAITSMNAVEAQVWDACANPPETPLAPVGCGIDLAEDSYNPFISHAFLSALEVSGSATGKTGWAPAHVLVEVDGEVAAAAPCYLKNHSRGEYVFDQGWADAYERAGGSYYPKLQVSVPFTPATGRRLLVRPGEDADKAEAALIAGLRALMRQTGASSTHVTFLPHAQWEALGAAGYLQRQDQQFHWLNESYADFDSFLGALASRKRKAIRKERREALAPGIDIEALTGSDITEAHWDAFFDFYEDTGMRKWGQPYLTRRFFSEVGARMADRVLLVMAKRGSRYIAGAINFIGANTLYGRHWGCVEQHPFLHFEVCYYQAIDFAIRRGLARVEAGAQGEHKLARGYRPVMTYSAHDIPDPGFRRAVADYLKRERSYVDAVQGELEGMTPFRHTADE